jgi:nicotinamidase-related amidase
MSNVVNLRPFIDTACPPTLVLVDLQQEYVVGSGIFADPSVAQAIANCRAALSHARALGLPIAFVRWSAGAMQSSRRARGSYWIEGFEPTRSDMVFERSRPSCFASSTFVEVMTNARGNLVLAGFTAEGACLATAVEAFSRGHRVTFLCDASASRAFDDIAASEVHRTVSKIIGSFGETLDTKAWIASTSWESGLGTENGNEYGRTFR